MPKALKIGDLNKIYTEADDCDREIYAEQRSNILLIAGDHYTRRAARIYNRIRGQRDAMENQRLRLTKNHIHKVYRHYLANILAYAPGVGISPKLEADMQSQKEAELNKAVWEDAKYRHRLHERVREDAQDFVGVGEVAVKIFFDPNRGELRGYEPKMQKDDTGKPITDEADNPLQELDEMGNVIPDNERPVFKGMFVFERIFGFNLLRCPSAKSMSESPYVIVRKMVGIDELKGIYGDDPEKVKFIQESRDETYVVFDQNRGEYRKADNQTLVREYYWKPCYDYPNGYWAITTVHGILSEGELPFGIFPIIWAGFDEYPTTPRGRSIVKQLRPFQGEINRASSQMAQHQITLGDDKLIYQGGTKLSPGSLLPGVRGITFNGVIPPTVLPGRDGSQYLGYIESQVKELYDVAELQEENEPHPASNTMDSWSMLFASLKQMRKFAMYGEKFEQFQVDKCELYLELAKHYLPDDELIYAVGKSEMVNIKEFRATTKLCYQIKLEPKNDTAETALGKQLSLNHILQYVGPQLGKDDIGKLIKNMPFGNVEESYRDLTIDYDVAKNDFLALERGEQPMINEYDNHEYIVKRLAVRIKEPDFRFLPQQVKMNYIAYKGQHEKFMAQQAQAIIDAKNEFIPVGGSMIACDMYVPNPEDPSKAAKRVRIPYQALDWLVQHLESQGMPLQKIESMNKGVVSDLTSMVGHQQMPSAQPQQQPMNRQASPMPQNPMPVRGMGQGPTSPLGVS